MSRWPTSRRQSTVRREAAQWFARNRGGSPLPAFEAWRSADPSHAEAYARMDAHFAASGAVERRVPPRRRRPLIAAAAAILVAAAALVPLALGGSAERTAIGEQRALALADGSRVLLDTATTLKRDYDGEVRRLILVSGRARFEVAHGDPRPFVVEAGELEVVATGTRFDVRIDGGRVEVALLDGSVLLHRGADRRRLEPGQMVSAGPRLESGRLDPGAAAAWPAGRLVFTDATLAEVVTEANRYARRPLRLGDPAMGARRITASFAAADTASIARILAASLHLRVVDAGGELVLDEGG